MEFRSLDIVVRLVTSVQHEQQSIFSCPAGTSVLQQSSWYVHHHTCMLGAGMARHPHYQYFRRRSIILAVQGSLISYQACIPCRSSPVKVGKPWRWRLQQVSDEGQVRAGPRMDGLILTYRESSYLPTLILWEIKFIPIYASSLYVINITH